MCDSVSICVSCAFLFDSFFLVLFVLPYSCLFSFLLLFLDACLYYKRERKGVALGIWKVVRAQGNWGI